MSLRPIFAQIERDFDSKRSQAAVGASGILDRLRNELFHKQILCPQENADRQIEQSVQLAEADYNAYWTRIHQDYDRWRDGAMKIGEREMSDSDREVWYQLSEKMSGGTYEVQDWYYRKRESVVRQAFARELLELAPLPIMALPVAKASSGFSVVPVHPTAAPGVGQVATSAPPTAAPPKDVAPPAPPAPAGYAPPPAPAPLVSAELPPATYLQSLPIASAVPIFASIEREFDTKRAQAAAGASGLIGRLRSELYHKQVLLPPDNANTEIDHSVQIIEADLNAFWTRMNMDYERWNEGAMKVGDREMPDSQRDLWYKLTEKMSGGMYEVQYWYDKKKEALIKQAYARELLDVQPIPIMPVPPASTSSGFSPAPKHPSVLVAAPPPAPKSGGIQPLVGPEPPAPPAVSSRGIAVAPPPPSAPPPASPAQSTAPQYYGHAGAPPSAPALPSHPAPPPGQYGYSPNQARQQGYYPPPPGGGTWPALGQFGGQAGAGYPPQQYYPQQSAPFGAGYPPQPQPGRPQQGYPGYYPPPSY